MMHTNSFPRKQWTAKSALVLMAVCLMAGVAGGWAVRGARPPSHPDNAKVQVAVQPAPSAVAPVTQAPAPDQMKAVADNQAAPLIAKLRVDPKNLELLTSIGNLYYDARQYSVAVDYYGRSLQINPSDAAVRTDMATAYWYMGNADAAIAEFNKALTYAPTNPNTLFNLGLVKWQGKHDSAGAIADWKKLLAANPNYDAKDKVEQMLSDAEKQVAARPGTKG
jgi:cytochrome c-type biogenesis protein CcmH/NrfG